MLRHLSLPDPCTSLPCGLGAFVREFSRHASKSNKRQIMKFLTFILTILGTGSLALAGENKPAYPLTTCVVSGEKLDAMGGPVVFTYEGQEVRLCCEHCKPKFEKHPEDYLKKIKDASK